MPFSEEVVLLALKQVPALFIVGVLLYIFLKAFERTVDKLLKAQDAVVEVIKENHAVMERWKDRQEDAAEELVRTSEKLSELVQIMEFTCPPKNRGR